MANSIAEDIADAAVALVTGLALSGVSAVVKRRTPGRREGDGATIVTVSVDEIGFEPATADDAKAWFCYYRLLVVIVRLHAAVLPGSDAVTLGADTIREWRQRIRRAVTGLTLVANGAAVDDCDPVPNASFDPPMMDAGVDYSPVEFEVTALEPR